MARAPSPGLRRDAALTPALRSAASLPFRLLPPQVRRLLVRAALEAVSYRDAPAALRELLTIESDLTASLNVAAQRYEGGLHVKHRLTGYHDFFVDHMRPGETVLDVGCGIGALAFSMVSGADVDVIGVDIEAKNIAEARRRFEHSRLSFVQADVLEYTPTRPVQTIVASNLLEHIDRRVEFVRALQQRLGAERWLIRVPCFDRDWRVPLRKELGLRYFSDPTHYTEYTVRSFEEETRAAGLALRHLQVNWGEIWAEAVPST